jgi:hypothetical protein
MTAQLDGTRIRYGANWLCKNYGSPDVIILPADHDLQICVHCVDRLHPAVYRCLGDDRSPVYIGSTEQYTRRLRQHEMHAEWWPLVAIVRRENFPTYADAYAAEQAAIRSELPLINRDTQGRPYAATLGGAA